jgi:hypothetical protein
MVRVAIALLVTASVLLVSAGPAAAGPVGKDGKIHACYRAKGKHKGALRILLKGKRCRRGERRVAWIAASTAGTGPTSGQPGQAGQPGKDGTPGAAGTGGGAGSTPDISALLAQIDDLKKRVEALEGVLKGITNADLVGLLGQVANVKALCSQASTMNNAFGALTDGIEGIGIIGGTLDFSSLPDPPPSFTCPT